MRPLVGQYDPVELGPDANLQPVLNLMERAVFDGGELLVLSEMGSTGYDLPAASRLRDRSAAPREPLTAAVCRVGSGAATTYRGQSQVMDPWGIMFPSASMPPRPMS